MSRAGTCLRPLVICSIYGFSCCLFCWVLGTHLRQHTFLLFFLTSWLYGRPPRTLYHHFRHHRRHCYHCHHCHHCHRCRRCHHCYRLRRSGFRLGRHRGQFCLCSPTAMQWPCLGRLTRTIGSICYQLRLRQSLVHPRFFASCH